MPEVQPPSTQVRQSLTSKRSLLRRFSSPFSAQSRTVADFLVQADDPHRGYGAGDLVKGSVILKLVKPTRITHIVVALHGFVQVYRSPNTPPTEGFRAFKNINGKGKNSKKGVYFGNGFISLFEEESVLCGDGRLEEGNYKFEFAINFPREMLPGSIDFERGTVTYMVTATLTRPNAISPVTFHDQKLLYNERIDIAQYSPPKPVNIQLEPVLRKTKSKSKASSARRLAMGDRTSSENGHSITSRSLAHLEGEARSISPSQRSQEESRSSPPISIPPPSSEHGSTARSRRTSDSASTRTLTSASGSDGRLITVTVNAVKGGVLRGEYIPLDIYVEHTKAVKSMQGVIVTLYRQARVDTHAALDIAPVTSGESRRREDYYPKSITGLGGLSLSAAGSSHVFRKDLSQIAVPLFVDPVTQKAELHPKIRVPEEAFPTNNRVPGQMISFRYFVEVIIDVQGKFRTPDKHHSQPKGNRYADITLGSPLDSDGRRSAYMHNPDFTPFIDTDPLRRDKTVASCVMEIIVGTENSMRNKGKERAETNLGPPSQSVRSTPSREYYRSPDGHGQPGGQNGYFPRTSDRPDYSYGDDYARQYDSQHPGSQHYENYDHYDQPPEFVPEDAVFDDALTEKERLRRAEAALLPSQPPEDDAEVPLDATGPPSQTIDAAGLQLVGRGPGHIVWADVGSSVTPRYSPSDLTVRGEHPGAQDDPAQSALHDQASMPPLDESHPQDDEHGPRVPRMEDLEQTLEARADDTTTAYLPRYER